MAPIPFDIEAVRVDFERTLYGRLKVRGVLVTEVDAPTRSEDLRRSLVSERLAESLREVDRALGCEPTSLVAASEAGVLVSVRSAALPRVLAVDAARLEHLPELVRRAVLGWYVGHALAHRGHPMYREAWAAGEHGSTRTSSYAYRRAAAVTADRCALLASRDVAAVCACIVGEPVDLQPWLEQARHKVDAHFESGDLDSTRLDDEIRTVAAWLFSETRTCRALLGIEGGTRRSDDVDELLARLLDPGQDAA